MSYEGSIPDQSYEVIETKNGFPEKLRPIIGRLGSIWWSTILTGILFVAASGEASGQNIGAAIHAGVNVNVDVRAAAGGSRAPGNWTGAGPGSMSVNSFNKQPNQWEDHTIKGWEGMKKDAATIQRESVERANFQFDRDAWEKQQKAALQAQVDAGKN